MQMTFDGKCRYFNVDVVDVADVEEAAPGGYTSLMGHSLPRCFHTFNVQRSHRSSPKEVSTPMYVNFGVALWLGFCRSHRHHLKVCPIVFIFFMEFIPFLPPLS